MTYWCVRRPPHRPPTQTAKTLLSRSPISRPPHSTFDRILLHLTHCVFSKIVMGIRRGVTPATLIDRVMCDSLRTLIGIARSTRGSSPLSVHDNSLVLTIARLLQNNGITTTAPVFCQLETSSNEYESSESSGSYASTSIEYCQTSNVYSLTIARNVLLNFVEEKYEMAQVSAYGVILRYNNAPTPMR